MARLPRYVIPGQPQHVMLRGNNRNDIFRAEADYKFFLEKLQLACSKHGAEIHAYGLMTNHRRRAAERTRSTPTVRGSKGHVFVHTNNLTHYLFVHTV